MSAPRYAYIISKYVRNPSSEREMASFNPICQTLELTVVFFASYRNIDPVFAIFIGASAAAVRINRDEKDKGRSTGDIVESLKRRVGKAFGS